MKTKVLFVVAAIMSCVSVMGQWNKSAESLFSWSEDVDKVEMGLTPNGSVWFALQCVSAETATTYLTMVDSEGNRPFDQAIVVSNYPSKAWISVGKTLYVDSDGNAIVAVSDQRKGVSGSEGYTVYKISPEGEFLWGEDGISLDGENVYSLVAGMSICQLDDGSYVFAWMHTHESDDTLYTIEMQRISDDGEMLWNAMDVRLHGDNDNYTYPYVVNGGNNQVIMLYAKGSAQDLYARKIDFDGTAVWSEDTRVYNGGWGSIPIWTLIDVTPVDGGFIVSWNDDRYFTQIESAYMTYVKSNGEIGFTSENGQMLGYAGLRSLNVSSYYDDTSDSFYAIWSESSAGQSFNRVVAQRISKEGELLWGENGLEIEKMNNNYSYSDFSIQSTDDNEIAFFYLQSSSSTEQIPIVATVHTSDTTFRAKSCISNYISNKRNLQSTPAYNDNWLVSWIEDKQLLIQGVSCELPRLSIGDKFTVDGIHYEVLNESGQVAVTYYGEDINNIPDEYKYAGEVVIPESVTYEGVTYSVTSIGYQAFRVCDGLTEITIPESVTSIGDYAFFGCTGLTEITIPESVTSIGDNAFSYCYGLTSMVVEDGNTVYDSRENCNAIIEIATNTLVAGCKKTIIPNSVTSIGYGAFASCSGLTEITIPESVTSIGDYAFSNCYGLTEITIPESVTSIDDYAFYACNGLISIKVEEGNTVYDSREGCNAIIETATNTLVAGCKKTIIPNSVTSIGQSAFCDCHGLTEITIPNSVTSIGVFAFKGCSGLTSITIPNSVTEIDVNAFGACSGLTSIKVEEGNTVYDSRENCNAIIETATNTLVVGCKKTIIPNSVTSIGDNAFGACTGLTSITIPNSVTSIGNYAFSSCYNLTSIRIEAVNAPAIEEYTFSGIDKSIPVYVPAESVEAYQSAEYWSEFTNIVAYTELEAGDKFTVDGIHYEVLNESGQVAVTYYGEDEWNVPEEYKYAGEVVIPETVSYQGATYSVTSIGDHAFYDCSGLTEITIPSNVTSIGNIAFLSCTGLTEITIPNSVTSIGEYAFSYCSGLTSVTIPNSVTSIGVSAFCDCDGLTEITIPESVTSIGDCAFNSCSGLTSVTIPNSVTSIGQSAFSSCSGLTSIKVEEGNTVYDSREGCNAIIETATNTLVAGCKKTIIPNSVTSIGQSAFYYCSGLTSITIPESVTSIGYHAFYECTGLTSITIPESVTSIGYHAFSGCDGLTEITIPNSITSIGQGAFWGCSGLTEITIPESVTSIGDDAYCGCTGLTSIKVEEGNTVYDSREGCNAIIETATNTLVAGCKKTIIPESVTSIGDYAFGACDGLTSITIPESVTSIGDYAFANCSGLTEITIPNSVTSIGDYAFSSCSGLTSIRIEAVNPPAIEDNTFDSVDKSIPVYVPTQECVEAYRNAEYWSEFTNIQSYIETLTYDVVVPAGTWECYIIGEFNQMSEFVPMTKINDTHYTITIEGVERSMHYQYACGNGREYVEAGDVRTYNENDVVEGWTNMPAVEAGEPEANRLQSGGVTVSRLYDVLSTARVPMVVELINEAAISALQCDIYLPEGLSVATVENGLDVAMGNRGSQDHTIDARTLDNGAIRVLVMSGTAAPLTGNAGALFTIGVIPNENYTEDAQIVICNIVMTDTDIVEYNPKQIFADCHIKESVLGDANSDGRVNVTDIILLAKYILGGYNGNIDVLAADINQDSRINVSDIVAMANLILSGKGAAGAPSRQEGVQGTLSMDHVLLNTNAPTIAPMMLDNTVAYTAFQMDVIVPEGLCIEDVVCGERLTAAHNLMWKEQADGSVRIIAFATDNTPIKESQGELFHLVLSAEDGFADGEIYVSDAIFVTRGMLTHQVNDIVAGVSAPTGIEAMYSNNRVYAAHRTIVIETTCEQPAYITTIDGVSQSIDLQPGRNVLQVSQQGVYIVTVGNENKKVVVK